MKIARMKADLPNMPEDVIDIWLATHYDRFGWPPTSSNEWRYILGRGNDLAWLQQLNWSKSAISLSPDILSPGARNLIVTLSRTHVLGETTSLSVMGDGLARFRRCCDYLKQNGVFLRPIVLGKTQAGYDVLDGNHRLTAYFYLYGYFNVENDETPDLRVHEEQEAWIAESPAGRMLFN